MPQGSSEFCSKSATVTFLVDDLSDLPFLDWAMPKVSCKVAALMALPKRGWERDRVRGSEGERVRG